MVSRVVLPPPGLQGACLLTPCRTALTLSDPHARGQGRDAATIAGTQSADSVLEKFPISSSKTTTTSYYASRTRKESDATCRSCRSEWLLYSVASNPKDREAVGGPKLNSPDWSVEAFIEMGEGAWPWYSDCDLFDHLHPLRL